MAKPLEPAYLKDKSVIVMAHVILAEVHETEYLVPRVKRLLVVRHPFKFATTEDGSLASYALDYRAGELKRKIKFPAPRGPEFLFWLKDAIASIVLVGRAGGKFDFFMGTNAADAFLGLVLRRLGRVRKVAYCPTDYIPARFPNRCMNRFYHRVEKACCYGADVIWDVSPLSIVRRYESGIEKERCAPAITVPNGNFFDDIQRKPISEINRRRLIYLGTITEEKGLEALVDIMPELITRAPGTELTIIGGGAAEPALKRQAEMSSAANNITFLGPIYDHVEIERHLTEAAIGLAPYEPTEDSYVIYCDPAKIKHYLACGLPVIINNVPYIVGEIAARKAGLVIPYDSRALTEAAVKLLTDDKLYADCRASAIEMGSDYAWRAIYSRAFLTSKPYLE